MDRHVLEHLFLQQLLAQCLPSCCCTQRQHRITEKKLIKSSYFLVGTSRCTKVLLVKNDFYTTDKFSIKSILCHLSSARFEAINQLIDKSLFYFWNFLALNFINYRSFFPNQEIFMSYHE